MYFATLSVIFFGGGGGGGGGGGLKDSPITVSFASAKRSSKPMATPLTRGVTHIWSLIWSSGFL